MSTAITQQEHDKLLKEIEPPWSWIHQFATLNCRDKSHNFLELQSIASDETPAESSDESFDFENNRFHEADDMDKLSESTDNRTVIEEMLLLDETAGENRATEHSAHDVVNVSGLINEILDIVQLAVANKEVDVKDTASIRSFLMDNNNQYLRTLDLRAVQKAIRNADEARMVFQNFMELESYLRKEMPLPAETKLKQESASLHSDSSYAVLSEKPSITNIQEKAQLVIETPEPQINQQTDMDSAITQPKPLESQFDDCQIDIDEKISSKPVPDAMILGLISTPPATPIIIPTPPRTPTPTPPSPHNTSSGIISENVSLHDFPPPLEPLTFLPPPPLPEKQPFQCRVPPMPGIGPAVSKETIRNVLTYLKGRSRNENGFVYPRHFLEAKCPNIIDTYEG